MRRLILVSIPLVLIPALLFGPAGCKRRRHGQLQAESADQGFTGPASVIHAADARVAPQFLSGFHPVESNAWRWTAGRFAVALKTPAGAREKGAVLQFKFAVPDPVINELKSVTLSASVDGTSLPPETYNAAGEQVYTRDVPASALEKDVVTVQFALDKALPPRGQDARELGVVASLIGLEAKP